MPAINIVDRVYAIQYTGTNSAEIDGLVTDFDILSEVGGVLVFQSGGNNFIANTDDWVRYAQGAVLNTHPTSFLDFAFIHNAVYDDLSALQTQLDELLASGALVSAGTKELPLLSPGTTVITVPLTVTLPTTSGYTPQSQLFASATLLGALTITATALASTSTVDVTVDNTGILGLSGARLFVTVT